jgi:acyl dehydratase
MRYLTCALAVSFEELLVNKSSPGIRNTDGPITIDSVAALSRLVNGGELLSEWIIVDQDMIDRFADLTGDRQWIHVDPSRAAVESPFGSTIAHGLLTLALIPGAMPQLMIFPGRRFSLNYGFDKIRFTSAVRVDSRLRVSMSLPRLEEINEDLARCEFAVRIDVEGAEKPALVATWLLQMGW